MVGPPFTASVCPLTNDAASLTRNSIGCAISSGRPARAIGLAAAAALWRVGIGRLLPWRALFLIAGVSLAAALPALAVSYGLQAPPVIRILAIGAVYVSVYAAVALGVGLVSSHERAAASQLLGKLQFMLPIRYQHKTS